MKPFIKVSLALMAAKAVVNKKTGEMLVFKDADKTLYSWMYAQYTHLRSQDKEFFHNQSFISAATFKSVSTVEKFVRRFVATGILHRKQISLPSKGSIVSNSYKVEDLDDDSLFEYVFEDELDKTYKSFITSSVSVQTPKAKKQAKVETPCKFVEEIDDYPF
jgi:hypothetical protein